MTISLNPRFIDAVASGQKRSTVRAGLRKTPLGPAMIGSRDRVFAIEITAVRYKRFGELTAEDAKTDGFQSLEELREALLGFYPDTKPDDIMTIIYFERALDESVPRGEHVQDDDGGKRRLGGR